MNRIDEIDAKILELLQQRGRMKRNAISEVVGLSVPAVSERMRKLEEHGLIQQYTAVVDAKRLNYDITAFIRVDVEGSEHYPDFVAAVEPMGEVLEVHSVTGDGSHILKVRTYNTTTLEKLLARIQALRGVGSTSSSIVLSTFKETREVATQPTELFDYEAAHAADTS